MQEQQASRPPVTANDTPSWHEFIIVGAGFSGIGAAIKLKQEGFTDFVILEKAQDLGGTWRDNTYPGLAVDIPSFVYSYPFEQNPDWSRVYAPGAEIKQYADYCTDKYLIRPFIRYGIDVVQVAYREDDNHWEVRTAEGMLLYCRFFISACGLLVKPKLPAIAGIDTFQGRVLHSARWDHTQDLTNKRVAVIGTGASAIQLIPEIAAKVGQLTVYQRTPIWLLPKLDGEINKTMKFLFRKIPLLQRLLRWIGFFLVELTGGLGIIHYKQIPWLFAGVEKLARLHIRKQVDDAEIQKKLTPQYTFFCKRPSYSNTYFKVFNQPNVELVTEPITAINEHAVLSADGSARQVDILVCATGFSFFERGSMPTFDVIGKGGLNLADYWQEKRFRAYEGATVPGLPNYFMIMGPYAIASASYFGMIDTQVHHMIRCLKEARRQGADYIEVKQAAFEKNQDKVFARMKNTVFAQGDCALANSYYFDKRGDSPLIRPVSYFAMWWKSRTFPLDDYMFRNV